MESNKLKKKIRDWATGLGFRLPNGSLPPADYFALLTATPNRRQLWEVIVESVLPRQKVEHMRKQIIVAKLQNKMKFSKRNYSQQVTDRIELWHRQNSMETEIKEKRNAVAKMEGNILAKASDLVFEICKLAEIEKQLEELNDKLLLLKLFSKRERKLVEELQSKLVKVKEVSNTEKNSEENLELIINQLLNSEKCKCSSVDGCNCSLLSQIEQICKSEMPEQYLWEEIIKHKKNLLQQFSEFLIQLNTSDKNIFSEKATQIEKNVNQLTTKLKQKMTLKSLQVMMNSIKGNHLESEIEKLGEKLTQKEPHYANETIALLSYRMNESYGEIERYKNLKSYLGLLGLKNYREFLKDELNGLEDEELNTRKKESPGGEQVQIILNDFASIINDINLYKSEEKEIGNEILAHHNKFEFLQRSLKEETDRMKETKAVEETAGKLKSASEKQIDVFLEIPLDAFRTYENSSGRISFECESESHCLENYGGELKHFFTTMLIPPFSDLKKITTEITNRKLILNQVKKFISERDKMVAIERQIQNRVNSIKYDVQLCEKNLQESDGILWNISSKSDQLVKEIDFVEKILKNWVEQPYRSMITEQVEGKSFKEFEEMYRKGKIFYG